MLTVAAEGCSHYRSSTERTDTSTSGRKGRGKRKCPSCPDNETSIPRVRPRRRSLPPILYDASQPTCWSTTTKRKRKYKRHEKHHRPRNRDTKYTRRPAPQDPIFVWAAIAKDTEIVSVVCEDYDKQNRLRLLKTENGWRVVPLTAKSPLLPLSPLVTSQPDAFHDRDSSSECAHPKAASPAADTSPVERFTTFDERGEIDSTADPPSPNHVDASLSPLPTHHASRDSPDCQMVDTSRIGDCVQQVVNDCAAAAEVSQIVDRGKLQIGLEDATVDKPVARVDECSQLIGTDNAVAIVKGDSLKMSEDIVVNAGGPTSCSDVVEFASEIGNDRSVTDERDPTIAAEQPIYADDAVSSTTKDSVVPKSCLYLADSTTSDVGIDQSVAGERDIKIGDGDECPKYEPVPIKLHSRIITKSNVKDLWHQLPLGRSPQRQKLKLSKSVSPRPTWKNEASSELASIESAASGKRQPFLNETLDWGAPRHHRQASQYQSSLDSRPASGLLSLLTSRYAPYVEEPNGRPSCLLGLLTSKYETHIENKLQQLKSVLANPEYEITDPLLVPEGSLPALISSPGKEIPRLLSLKQSRNLSLYSILSDPDVLVVSLSHLQNSLKKPISEEEIRAYQEQTGKMRSYLRHRCEMANWDPCSWMSENTIWQDFLALELMSAHILRDDPLGGFEDDDNNNVCSGKNACNMMRNQNLPLPPTPPSLFTDYKRCLDTFTASAGLAARLAAQHVGGYANQLSYSTLPSVPPDPLPPCGLTSSYRRNSFPGDSYHGVSPDSNGCQQDQLALHDALSSQAVDESKKRKQTPAIPTEEKKPTVVCEERENKPPAEEGKSAASNRPMSPKIKVRKHLVDPNQQPPRLLNQNTHIFRPYPPWTDQPETAAGGPHLWHPLFNSNGERNYKRLQWITPPVLTAKTSASTGS